MFVLTVDENGSTTASQISRLVRIHETPQDPVVVVYTDVKLPDGYTINKFDGLVEHFIKSEPARKDDKNVKKALREQKIRIAKDKFANK